MSSKSPKKRLAAKRSQPETLRGRALSASLTVADINKSFAWYTDALGFALKQKYERDGRVIAIALKAGVVELLIAQDDGSKGMDRAKGVGLSFQITTAQDVDAIATRVKSTGTSLASEPADMFGARAFRVRDPDGFMLVISSVRKE